MVLMVWQIAFTTSRFGCPTGFFGLDLPHCRAHNAYSMPSLSFLPSLVHTKFHWRSMCTNTLTHDFKCLQQNRSKQDKGTRSKHVYRKSNICNWLWLENGKYNNHSFSIFYFDRKIVLQYGKLIGWLRITTGKISIYMY